MLEDRNTALLQVVQQYQARGTKNGGSDSVTGAGSGAEWNEYCHAGDPGPEQSLMDTMKMSADDQMKMTQSWAEVEAGAPAAPTSAPTPPGLLPPLSTARYPRHPWYRYWPSS